MSFLSTSVGATIHDGQFTNAQTINNYSFRDPSDLHDAKPEISNSWKILERNVAFDAFYDSDARFDPPKCHPDTRTAVLDRIQRWATDVDSSPLMWVRGAAGAGKSAIAQTLAEHWDEMNSLAASFYFFRTAARRNEKKYFVATLAHQIATSIPGTRSYIENAIRQTPKIFDRTLKTQMRQLVINPLMSLSKGEPTAPRVVVIDGLDECCVDYPNQDHEQQQKEILQSIHLALGQKGFPLRFLIASRPERQIREIFDHGFLASIASRVVLDDTQNPSADIELYLRCKLEEIRKAHPYLGASWPSEDIIAQLVAKSSGHFIYAAVVMRYLSSPRANPNVGLKAIMGMNPVANNDSPFAELDALYMHILNSVAEQSLPTVMDLFGLMICTIFPFDSYDMFSSITRMSPSFVSKYLFVSLGELYLHLIDLHSILDIPSVNNPSDTPISFLHASFSEFLTEASRAQQFHIDRDQKSLQILSISVRHLFIQILSPRGATETEEYCQAGFSFQTTNALERIVPNDAILQALQALLTEDEQEFLGYIHREGLNVHGTTRQSIGIIRFLYNLTPNISNGVEFSYAPDMPVILTILKEHYGDGFVPLVDPFGYSRELYSTNTTGWVDQAEEIKPIPHEQMTPSGASPSNLSGHSAEESLGTSTAPQVPEPPLEPTDLGAGLTHIESIMASPPVEPTSSDMHPAEAPHSSEELGTSSQQHPEAPTQTMRKSRKGLRTRITGFLIRSANTKYKS